METSTSMMTPPIPFHAPFCWMQIECVQRASEHGLGLDLLNPYLALYRVSPKKRNGGFSVPCELKVLYYFTPLDKASSAEENDTKIIKFCWVSLILYSFLEMQSFSNFPWILRPMSEELCMEKASIMVFCGSLLIRVSFVATDQWASPERRMKDFSRHNSSLIGREIQANLKMTIARSGHRF